MFISTPDPHSPRPRHVAYRPNHGLVIRERVVGPASHAAMPGSQLRPPLLPHQQGPMRRRLHGRADRAAQRGRDRGHLGRHLGAGSVLYV